MDTKCGSNIYLFHDLTSFRVLDTWLERCRVHLGRTRLPLSSMKGVCYLFDMVCTSKLAVTIPQVGLPNNMVPSSPRPV